MSASIRSPPARPGAVGNLVLMHDLSFIARRSQDTRKYLIILIASLGAAIALVTVIVAQLSWRGWVSGAHALLRGEGLVRPMLPPSPELAPLAADLRERLRDLEDEYRRVQRPEDVWSAERLQTLLRTQLRGDQVIVVSNREPYMHEMKEGRLAVRRPASGLVTALEPVLRACDGTWIAHGSGDGDRQAVDRHDRVPLPPGEDAYLLRRVWLTQEQEQGYYYGFANEGLWPLCHVAHVRPVFREADWEHYREVNQLFADAVVAEARSEDPRGPRAGLPLRAVARDGAQAAAARHHPHLLAHPLAESRILRHLSVAQRNPGRPAGEHHPRLPHALPLQELHGDGGPLPRGAHRARAFDHHLRRRADAGGELSDLDRVAFARGGALLADAGPEHAEVFERLAVRRISGRGGRGPLHDYTKGIPSSG